MSRYTPASRSITIQDRSIIPIRTTHLTAVIVVDWPCAFPVADDEVLTYERGGGAHCVGSVGLVKRPTLCDERANEWNSPPSVCDQQHVTVRAEQAARVHHHQGGLSIGLTNWAVVGGFSREIHQQVLLDHVTTHHRIRHLDASAWASKYDVSRDVGARSFALVVSRTYKAERGMLPKQWNTTKAKALQSKTARTLFGVDAELMYVVARDLIAYWIVPVGSIEHVCGAHRHNGSVTDPLKFGIPDLGVADIV